MFLVVDDMPFTMEAWKWYHERMNRVNSENHFKIDVFRPWLKEDHREGEDYIDTYGQLSGWDFYEFLVQLYMVYTDIHSVAMDTKVTFEEQEMELRAVEDRVIYWALTVKHDKEDFGPGMRSEYLDSNRMAFNQKFHIESYYMLRIMWNGLERCKKALGGVEMQSIPVVNIFNYTGDLGDVDEFIKKVIREAYGGDFDEFIISVMDKIKYDTMTPEHEKMAKIRAFELFGNEDFEKQIPSSETWRLLHNTHFDDVEDVYRLFYEKFRGPCIMYLYSDYLSWVESSDTMINYIPVYKQYTDEMMDTADVDIRYFVDVGRIRDRIKRLYNIRIR